MLLGNGLGFWNTMPTRRRSSATSTPLAKMLWPSRRISPSTRQPSTRSFIRLKQRSKVDLPQPDGPMKAVTRCFGMFIRTSKRACLAP
ncbi:hypothetical protein M004_01925 [Pseudomonas aeruginosa M10]|nr:hypothetical protein M004_01925 [Pseudomonas aeruginosa M10]